MIDILRKIILQDFWLKLFSFVLAVLTWFSISSVANQKEGLSPISPLTFAPLEKMTLSRLPVVILSSAQDVRSVRVSPNEVDVTVQGEAKVLKTLQNKDIRVLVDLTGIGEARALRKRIEVSTPAGVTYVRVAPEEVEVILPSANQP
jgi:YbbR domain-containing protein